MRNSLPSFLARLLAALLVAILGGFSIASAQHITDQDITRSLQDAGDDPDDDDQGESRVARLSFVSGDVSFLRDGDTEWAAAVVNLPLLAGDHIYCPAGARAEIQLGRGTYIRLSEKTELALAVLSESVAQLEIVEGTANIRVDYLAAAFDRFEVDTPSAALLLQKDGQYRIDVGEKGESEIIVRRGIADVTTTDGSFKVREGYKLQVGDAGRLEIALDNSLDDWDRWIYDRDTNIDRTMIGSSPDDVNSYETDYNSFYGASDLSSYGSWTSVSSYGNCWLPRVSSGWAPYRFGEWVWVSRLGWTWISYEPWGWAPYHYGRWVYMSNLGWAWVPGFNSFPHRRSYFYWRPALVGFFNCPTPSGHYVGWYPLHPGERWRRPEHYSDHGSPIRGGARRPDISRDARERRGASWIPVSGFIRPGGGQSGERGSGELGRSRPQAPDRNLGPIIGGNQRPGLPTGTPGRAAMAPGGRWTSVQPSADIISRPVITRNLPAPTQGATGSRPNASGVSLAIPRQRTLVEPAPVRSAPARGVRLDVDGGQVIRRGDTAGRSDAADNNRSGDGVRSRRPVDVQESGNAGRTTESTPGTTNRDSRRQDGTIVRRAPVMTEGGERPSNNDSTRSTGDSRGQSGGDNSGSTRARERERQRGDEQNSGGNSGRPTGGSVDSGTPRSDRNRNSDDGGRWRSAPEVITRPAPDTGTPRRAEPPPEPRREQPRAEPKYEQPKVEPRHEQPRSEPRNDSRPEPRVEPKHEQPQQRSEPPRAEPKHESPPPSPPAKHDPPPTRPGKP